MSIDKKFFTSIEELKAQINQISVYDLNVYTAIELYYMLSQKINEMIKELMRFEGAVDNEVIEQNKKLLYLLGEGLKEQVSIKIQELHNDGTLESIINEEIFSHKVDKTNLELYAHKSSATGDTILLKTNKGKVIVVDTGSASDTGGVDTFIANHTSTIDYLIITHYHSDHIGNFEYVLNKYKNDNTVVILPCDPHYDQFMLNGAEFEIASNNVKSFLSNIGITPIIPTEQQIIKVDDIKLKFLNCSLPMFSNYYDKVSEYAKQNETDYNNFSMVVDVTHGVNKILLTGDINVTAQEKLIPYISSCNVLKAPHHSVDSDVSLGFIRKCCPQVVFSCNKGDSSVYKAKITRYFTTRGIPYFVTYQSGEIEIISDGISIKTNNKQYASTISLKNLFDIFQTDTTIYYGLADVDKSYSSDNSLTLEFFLRKMIKGSMCITNFNNGYGCTPSFISSYGGHGVIFKTSDSKAIVIIVDSNPNTNNTSIGVWLENADKNATIKWRGVADKDVVEQHIDGHKQMIFSTYGEMSNYGNKYSDSDMSSITSSSTALDMVKALPPGSSYQGYVTQSFDNTKLDTFGGMVEIIKGTNDKVAQVKLTQLNPTSNFNYYFIGIYHANVSTTNIYWKKLTLESI